MTTSAGDRGSLNPRGLRALCETEELYESDGAKENWNCS
jgi:hypothetical protein